MVDDTDSLHLGSMGQHLTAIYTEVANDGLEHLLEEDFDADVLALEEHSSTPRLWHFVGNELRYAFLVEGDTILTKEGAGYVEVTDARLNPVEDYHINAKAFNEAMKGLNRFFK